jgi:hypothetical protein
LVGSPNVAVDALVADTERIALVLTALTVYPPEAWGPSRSMNVKEHRCERRAPDSL